MADARLLVLVSLSDGAKHGYAIQADVADFAGVRLGPGTLYGALRTLERDGLVQGLAADHRRQPYNLTSAGRDRLHAQLDELERVLQRVGSVAT